MPLPKPKPTCTAEDYWTLPQGQRAELIDGELWDLAAPSGTHQEIEAELVTDLRLFVRSHGGPCKVFPAPYAVNLFSNDATFVEPDVVAVCDRSKLSDRGCEGAPDFVVEIVSPGNPGMDYLTKLNLYHQAGVREYWICDPSKRRTHVYLFGDGWDETPSIYPFTQPVPSAVFPGFSMDFGHVMEGM